MLGFYPNKCTTNIYQSCVVNKVFPSTTFNSSRITSADALWSYINLTAFLFKLPIGTGVCLLLLFRCNNTMCHAREWFQFLERCLRWPVDFYIYKMHHTKIPHVLILEYIPPRRFHQPAKNLGCAGWCTLTDLTEL